MCGTVGLHCFTRSREASGGPACNHQPKCFEDQREERKWSEGRGQQPLTRPAGTGLWSAAGKWPASSRDQLSVSGLHYPSASYIFMRLSLSCRANRMRSGMFLMEDHRLCLCKPTTVSNRASPHLFQRFNIFRF